MDTFQADTIYALKMDYGSRAVFTQSSTTTNPATGAITSINQTFIVQKAIKLETVFKQTLLKLLGQEKQGYRHVGDFELLVDRNDIPRNRDIVVGSKVTTDRGDGEVVSFHKFDEALLLSIKSL